MAFPTVQSITKYEQDANQLSHDVTMPATVNAGDLLLMLWQNRGNGVTPTVPDGWTIILPDQSAGGGRHAIYAKIANGTEGGGTATVAVSASRNAVALTYRISGWFGDLSGLIVSDVAEGSSTTPDPPSWTIGWGSKDTLWIAACVTGGSVVSGFPSSYSGTTYGVSNGQYVIGTAWRQNATATEDPSAFTNSDNGNWDAYTIGVRPVPEAAAIDDPVGWWRMDNDVLKSAGSVDGTAVGSPTFTTGQIGQAIVLNGSTQYVQLGDNFDFDTFNAFSLAFWYKSSSATPAASWLLMDKVTNSGNFPGWVIFLAGATSGDPIQAALNADTSGRAINIQFAHTMSTAWRHVVLTYNGGKYARGMRVYEDGSELTSRTIVDDDLPATSATSTNSATACIGARNGAVAPFNGQMDDVRIYNRELTPAEVALLYAWDGTEPGGGAAGPLVGGGLTRSSLIRGRLVA